ncbi:hypothetical protein JOF56_000699 [Kibdelosporangium banguiense]|uniref:Lipoprotein n=1 Tax=Kibdelosporangium banguiense TaxID=1365924 RepID=A0ABS4T7B4_9PSEU|nr:hypothetical protein [Kibdelosporangium banguiense]MBP2320314.1 hypothetical protein [Kibdelosporangium banguiense]
MKKKVALAVALACTAAALTACTSNETKFADELKAAGFGNVAKPTSETEKKSKKIGGRTIKSSQKVLEAMVRVKGCDLEFEKVSGQSGYWLDELHVNGTEPDWPGYPENLRKQQVESLLAGNGPKPEGFVACYKPNEA